MADTEKQPQSVGRGRMAVVAGRNLGVRPLVGVCGGTSCTLEEERCWKQEDAGSLLSLALK